MLEKNMHGRRNSCLRSSLYTYFLCHTYSILYSFYSVYRRHRRERVSSLLFVNLYCWCSLSLVPSSCFVRDLVSFPCLVDNLPILILVIFVEAIRAVRLCYLITFICSAGKIYQLGEVPVN